MSQCTPNRQMSIRVVWTQKTSASLSRRGAFRANRLPLLMNDEARMPASRQMVNRLRPLLALLTVMAAFMFQLRLDALGGLEASPHGAHGALRSTATAMAEMADPPAAHHHSAVQSAPGPATLPQSQHNHTAHCPFCLTNAFGLQASVEALPPGPPDYLPLAQSEALEPFLAFARHADARAPPPSG